MPAHRKSGCNASAEAKPGIEHPCRMPLLTSNAATGMPSSSRIVYPGHHVRILAVVAVDGDMAC